MHVFYVYILIWPDYVCTKFSALFFSFERVHFKNNPNNHLFLKNLLHVRRWYRLMLFINKLFVLWTSLMIFLKPLYVFFKIGFMFCLAEVDVEIVGSVFKN